MTSLADAAGLTTLVDSSPTPFHAVAAMAARLEADGYEALDETAVWTFAPGDKGYVVRDGGSLVAFRVGSAPPSTAGFRLVGAHTDSPTFRVRPRPDVTRAGYRLVGVEPYGGVLRHTWMDRDLTLAGRVAVRDGDGIATRLVVLPGAPLRIPSLAIHLDRELARDGLKLDPQRHLVPVVGLDTAPGLREVVADVAGVAVDGLLGFDLVTADTQPAAIGGLDERFVLAPRLDNLSSCAAGLDALLDVPAAATTQVLVANDHEEVGSGSAEGARGPFLGDVLRRVVVACEPGEPQAFAVACARSRLVSADAAHAVHPNYAERHEPEHQPRFGGGPVLKANANQAYATDAVGEAWFARACADAGVALQHFVSRADLPCGSTIGPLTATRLGIATVDVGAPLLSMHSIREQVHADDVTALAAALGAHLATEA